MVIKTQSKTRKRKRPISSSGRSEKRVNIGAVRRHKTKVFKNSTKVSSSSPIIKQIRPLDDQSMPYLEEMAREV